MPSWLIEIIAVIAISRKTQWALILGGVSFIGVQILGHYMLSDFQLHGPGAALTDAIKQRLAGKYDEIAWASLIAWWIAAFKAYRRDRDRFFR